MTARRLPDHAVFQRAGTTVDADHRLALTLMGERPRVMRPLLTSHSKGYLRRSSTDRPGGLSSCRSQHALGRIARRVPRTNQPSVRRWLDSRVARAHHAATRVP
jgi:hypothetical protein